MRTRPKLLVTLASLALYLSACGRTSDADRDAHYDPCIAVGRCPDADVRDGARDAGMDGDGRVPRCGDAILDPGEVCDDGNTSGDDGCTAQCRWEARCGDGRTDPGEVCDDGNNRSADGCRSDCRSNEQCNNGVVDTAVGELCDGTPNCGANCRAVTACGNNRVDPGEQCDDGNTARWDGCAPDCRTEQGLVISSLVVEPGTSGMGCDFSGDHRPDNAFGRALGTTVGLFTSAINSGISNGSTLLQLGFLGLDDPLGTNDADVRVGWLRGRDGDTDALNNLDPGNAQRVAPATLNMLGLPQVSYQATLAMAALAGGPEDIQLDLTGPNAMPFAFRLQRSRVAGQLANDMVRLTALTRGSLCGAIPARDLNTQPDYIGSLLNFAGTGRDAGMRGGTFLGAIVGGYRLMVPVWGTLVVPGAQPDVDLDGDGLEYYEVTGGRLSTAPRIVACIDGDGTRVEGPQCASDPRFADGFSAAFQLNAKWVRFVGVASP